MPNVHAIWLLLPWFLTTLASSQPAEDTSEYVRSTAKGSVKECTFTLRASREGWTVVSTTYRGATQLALTSRYDGNDHLQEAKLTLTEGQKKTTATVEVKGGQAKILRDGKPAQEFDAVKGAIVTSAPDWTDIWLLCRRYDRKKGGGQTFPGLWIHPTQAAQSLPFKIERTGTDEIQHEGKELKLDRFTIRIRGPNPYAAWADSEGRLVKLAPLPYKEGTAIVRREYAESAKGLVPK